MREKPRKPEAPKPKKDAPQLWKVELSMTAGVDEQVSMKRFAKRAKLAVGDIAVTYEDGKLTVQQGREHYSYMGHREPFQGTRLVLDVGELKPPT